jgi:hypothetical protein
MVVMRLVGEPVTDQDLVREYERRRGGLMLSEQSAESIVARRGELVQTNMVVFAGVVSTKTGGIRHSWRLVEQ